MKPKYLFSIMVVFVFFLCSCSDEKDKSDISMITPYVSSNQIAGISRTFSSSEGASSSPWGVAHPGLDFSPIRDSVPFRSVCKGIVESITEWQNDISSTWQVNVRIKYNDIYQVDYAFEPASINKADGDSQLARIYVHKGMRVEQGQTIGVLKLCNSSSHVHFMLIKNSNPICPEPYFTEAARDSINNLIHKYHSNWNMCY